ncbi:ABC transporter permease [Pollutibacter soli]|uniref:ABC transporter permease n=1 Tax=Pollutibacter soli TaxID=3034157 RepID=UPI003013DBC9
MFRNYIKTAWRNLWKNKTFSAINIAGLSLGTAAFLLITNYLHFENSYDDFQTNKDRIYRIPMVITEQDGKEQTFAFTYPAVAPAMKKDFPEIEQVIRLRRQGGIVSYKDQHIPEGGNLYYVDPEISKVFTFEFLKGNEATAMQELNDAIITASTANKYFGSEDPIGKALRYRDEDHIVKAVIADQPANAHFQFNILLNYNKYIALTNGRANTSWGWSDFYTYVLLKPGTNPKAFESKFPAFAEKYQGADMKADGFKIWYKLQPIKDIHLRSSYDYEFPGNGNLTYLKYLAIAAIFILFIAWINYINLATARSLERAREVGVRKVVGAGKFQLILQFISESLILNLGAVIIGVVVFKVTQTSFSSLVGKEVSDIYSTNWKFWVFCLSIFIGGSLVAAFYPAFILSSFQPIRSLKNNFAIAGGRSTGNMMRKSLVVIQFVAAIILISSAIGFYRQLKFMQSRDLGVDIEQTLVLQQSTGLDSADIPKHFALINELKTFPGVNSVTVSSSIPGGEVGGSAGFQLQNSNSEKRCRILAIDSAFIPSYKLTVMEGRNITTDRAARDSSEITNVILNETAAKIFGFSKPGEIVGKNLTTGGSELYHIIGVVKDFHQESLEYSFDPIVMYPGDAQDFGNYSIKTSTANVPKLIEFAEKKWKASFPESPFRYLFLDEYYNLQYKNDQLFATVLWLFTVIGIVIACLGLFGLSLYTIAKRSKEISIRKVLGASMIQLTQMMTVDHLKLIAFSGLIGIPVANFIVKRWLSKYAFHIEIQWWFYLLPLMMILCVALITVIWQSVRAALTNPVKSLRAE